MAALSLETTRSQRHDQFLDFMAIAIVAMILAILASFGNAILRASGGRHLLNRRVSVQPIDLNTPCRAITNPAG